MKFLVTGGAGFIGSHIVERLLSASPAEGGQGGKEGHFVRILDNLSSGKLENLSFAHEGIRMGQCDFLKADIRDFDICKEACEGIDFILHQAALRSVPKSMKNPYEYNEVNINGTLNMLKAAKECGVKRFVFASSSSVYGETDHFPEREDFYPLLISPYALTKLAGEYYCRIFSQNFGLETVSLRYFNVFGPRQALDDEYAVVIPKFITCILNDEQPPIFGNGKQSRDFTYIDNVVEANILAAITKVTKSQSHKVTSKETGDVVTLCPGDSKSVGRVFNEVFNVACGKDQSILDLVDTLNKIIGKSIKPVFKPIRPGDVFKTLADISKAKILLGYEPKVNFEEGLRKTAKWFEVRKEVYIWRR